MRLNKHVLALSTAYTAQMVFNPNAGKWLTDADGNLVVRDGNPVMLIGDGQEMPLSPERYSSLIGENKSYRVRAQKAEDSLKPFEGLDPDTVKDALDKVSKIDSKALIDAGKVDEVRDQMKAAYETQISDLNEQLATANQRGDDLTLGAAFTNSAFLRDRLLIPADMVQQAYRNNFKVEDGKVVPYDANGQVLYSGANPGTVATVDEALEMLVSQRPDKDTIMKAYVPKGSGNTGGGGTAGGVQRMTRDEFAKLEPAKQAEFSAQVRENKAQLVD